MSDDRETARALPLAIYRLLDAHVSANRNLKSKSKRDAFRALNVGYSQLREAMKGDVSLGARFYESFLENDWLKTGDIQELQALFVLHRAHWDREDNRRKERSTTNIGQSDLLAFKRMVHEKHPDIARRLSTFRTEIDSFNFLCNRYIEDTRISGKASSALINGLCICLWIKELDEDSYDFNILYTSAIRLTIYAAFYIHDTVIFRRLLNELKRMSERSKHPWIASAFHQNSRRLQVNFSDENSRDIKQIIFAGRSAHEAATEAHRHALPQSIISMWSATPLLAHQALVQSQILSRQIKDSDINSLRAAEDQYLDRGFNTDATLITKLVIAEGYIYLKRDESCEEQLNLVETKVSPYPHRFDGIRAVARRISGDLELLRFSTDRKHYTDSIDKAVALYDQARYHFTRFGNVKTASKISLRRRLADEISSFSGTIYDAEHLLDDYRFREPIW